MTVLTPFIVASLRASVRTPGRHPFMDPRHPPALIDFNGWALCVGGFVVARSKDPSDLCALIAGEVAAPGYIARVLSADHDPELIALDPVAQATERRKRAAEAHAQGQAREREAETRRRLALARDPGKLTWEDIERMPSLD